MADIEVEQPRQTLRLIDFGPPPGTGDAAPAIQAMVDYGFANGMPAFEFGAREYDINTTVVLPKVTTGPFHRSVWNGNGAVFNVASGVTVFDRTSTDLALQNGLYWSPVFRDMSFIGTDKTGSAIRWWESFAAKFENIYLEKLDIGIEVLFGLYANHSNCNARECLRPYRAIGGDGPSAANLTGGTQNNANSNLVAYRNCRTQLVDATATGFYLSQANNWLLENCVVEGSSMDIGVAIIGRTSQGSVADRTGKAINLHVEPTTLVNQMVAINLPEAVVEIDGMYFNNLIDTALDAGTPGICIDTTGSTDAKFLIRNTRWNQLLGMATGKVFADTATGGQANTWYLADNMIATGNTLSDAGLWSGTVPADLVESRTKAYT